jgi:hypothetical protein
LSYLRYSVGIPGAASTLLISVRHHLRIEWDQNPVGGFRHLALPNFQAAKPRLKS